MEPDAEAEARAAEEARALAKAAKLPVEEQIADKSWKVRKQCFEHLAARLQTDISCADSFISFLPKAVADSNQSAQEAGVDLAQAVLSVLESARLQPVAADLADGLAGNALTSRPGITTKAREALLSLVEHGFAEQVIAAESKRYLHKVPKAALAAVDATLDALSQFGPAVVPPKQILPELLAAAEKAKDAKVRNAAKDIVFELAKWVGREQVRSSTLPKLREAQRTEIEAHWEKTPEESKSVPTRLTHQQRKQHAVESATSPKQAPAQGNAAPAPQPAAHQIDLDLDDDYDSLPAVDLATQLPRDFASKVDATKWSERRDALQALKAAAGKSKADASKLADIVAALKKVISKDSNAACVAEACACASALAFSARKGFREPAKQVLLPLCISKLKDKNSAVQREASAAMDAIQKWTLSLKDTADTIAGALAATNPQEKQLTLAWLTKQVSGQSSAELKRVHETLLPPIAALTADATPAVRDAAVSALAAFASVGGGTTAISKHLAKLDERRLKQLEVRVKRLSLCAATMSLMCGVARDCCFA